MISNESLQRLLQAAIDHHMAGRLARAEGTYRKILELDHNQADALHLLGVLAAQVGKHEQAVALIEHAVKLKPSNPLYWCNFGKAFRDSGRFDDAINAFQKAIKLNNGLAEAHFDLGGIFLGQKRFDDAANSLLEAVRIHPDFAEAHNSLAVAFKSLGKIQQAVKHLNSALASKPGYAVAHNNLGVALNELGRKDEAISHFQQAIFFDEAYAEAHYNLGNALKSQHQLDEAESCYLIALSNKPDYIDAQINLGAVLKDLGRAEEAVDRYQMVLDEHPNHVKAYSNLLFSMLHDPRQTPIALLDSHKRFADRFESPLVTRQIAHSNVPGADRIRIGYLSPDFRRHPVAFFMEPILANHDKKRFEIFCYFNHRRPDDVTSRIIGYADQWVNCKMMSDEELAAKIRTDRIDILVDLAGHTSGNRLLVFARKPAPIQISYLGYLGTTGLNSMDFRLTDWHADPVGFESFYTEKLLRLPHSQWCYRPSADMPDVSPLPALQNGYLTFGSLNSYAKVDTMSIGLWAKLLQHIPSAKLLMLTVPAGNARQRLIESFTSHGIAENRLEIHGRCPRDEYLRLVQQADIALDPLAVNGATTMCEALWLGVPTLTLAGNRFTARAGFSVLQAAGLSQFAVKTERDLLDTARAYAEDLTLLAQLRKEIRMSVESSTLTNEIAFVQSLEALYFSVAQHPSA